MTAAHGLIKAGVIGQGADAAIAQGFGQGLGALARSAIHDAAFAPVAPQELGDLTARLVLGREAQAQVRAVEAVKKDLRPGRKQPLDHVLAGGAVGGRGQRQRLDRAEHAARAGEVAVLGAEIVSPLRDAVRLVDGETPRARLLEARR